MVGAGALDNVAVRDGFAPGRDVPHRDAVTRGQEFPHVGCFLEIIENEKMVMTNTLEPGYRPASFGKGGEMVDCTDIPFTSILTLEEHGGKTHYSVVVLHKDEAGRRRHEEMGFHEGWNTCLDQLIDVVSRLEKLTHA